MYATIPAYMFGELLNNGVRVYLLREPKLVKKMRQQNNLKKSDENDAYILSLIPGEFFRELKLEEVEVKEQLWPLISRYETLTRRVKVLKQWSRNSISSRLKDLIKDLEKEKEEIGEEVHRIAMGNELYRQALEYFGLKKSVDLAILVTYVDFSRGKCKIKRYLGLIGEGQTNYNHNLRKRLSAFAMSYYFNIKRGVATPPEKYINIIKEYSGKRDKTLYKIQCRIVEDLRRLWLKMNREQTTRTIQEIPTGR